MTKIKVGDAVIVGIKDSYGFSPLAFQAPCINSCIARAAKVGRSKVTVPATGYKNGISYAACTNYAEHDDRLRCYMFPMSDLEAIKKDYEKGLRAPGWRSEELIQECLERAFDTSHL